MQLDVAGVLAGHLAAQAQLAGERQLTEQRQRDRETERADLIIPKAIQTVLPSTAPGEPSEVLASPEAS